MDEKDRNLIKKLFILKYLGWFPFLLSSRDGDDDDSFDHAVDSYIRFRIIIGVIAVFITCGFLYYINVYMVSKPSDPQMILEQPTSYESKEVTSFQVFKVMQDAALAREISDTVNNEFYGTTVLLRDGNFKDEQVVKVKHPLRLGIYTYTTEDGVFMTIPVIDAVSH